MAARQDNRKSRAQSGRLKSEKPSGNRRSKPGGLRIIRGRYIIGLALAALLGKYVGMPMVEAVRSHPVFSIRNVVVEGADYIEPEEIIQTADIPRGENIFDFDIAAIAEHLETSYAAEDFVVYKKLPDTVAIKVRERKPVALLNANKIIGVDENGVPLPHVGASYVETLPIISGISSVEALSDSSTLERLKSGIALLGAISEKSPGVYGRISEVDVSSISDMGITLLDNGLQVIIGSDDWNEKVPKLEDIIGRVGRQMEAVRAVDIRFGDKLFIRKSGK